jgi:glutathionylspermidine synthase
MQRLQVEPRRHWRQDCESVGFNYHSMDGIYWGESHCYRFTAVEVKQLEDATRALHELALEAVEHIIANERFDELAIPAPFVDCVKASWRPEEPTLAGRFDLAFDGNHPPKLLEYSADTQTALLEASIVQWRWLEQAIKPRIPDAD